MWGALSGWRVQLLRMEMAQSEKPRTLWVCPATVMAQTCGCAAASRVAMAGLLNESRFPDRRSSGIETVDVAGGVALPASQTRHAATYGSRPNTSSYAGSPAVARCTAEESMRGSWSRQNV